MLIALPRGRLSGWAFWKPDAFVKFLAAARALGWAIQLRQKK
jgi:hypothetical protein